MGVNFQRLDGRGTYDYRKITITFGIDRGCCHVQIGDTRVMAQVSCEVTTPKQTRPNEGLLYVNAELSPMAAPHFEAGRPSQQGVELGRCLERCLKESRCIDTESLCIMSGMKVWAIRVDVHVLNHDGNLIDACSMAAITALTHFRRPDVTVSGEEVTILSVEDQDPIALGVHHMPICVSFAFFHQGKYLLVDPNEMEERVMDGKMVIGMNKHRELVTLQLTGSMLLHKDQVLRCTQIASTKVQEMTKLIEEALKNDVHERATGGQFGSASSQDPSHVTSHVTTEKTMEEVDTEALRELARETVLKGRETDRESPGMTRAPDITLLGKQTGRIGEGGLSSWDVEDIEESEEDDVEMIADTNVKVVRETSHISKCLGIDSSEDSEEDVTETLAAHHLGVHESSRGASGDTTIDLTTALNQQKRPAPGRERGKVKR
ncbi:hypothetical protein NP493_675g02001 [Ridgeia piscesae]|uniref:Exosome complex component RRP45 n=1 Tax=Ridgeia piscesae TaxID=27915 RepID=A0AAD9KRK5_RIDPI|nr:hypothetical protein NP493_675g02001 [Ridgeia piscesae]